MKLIFGKAVALAVVALALHGCTLSGVTPSSFSTSKFAPAAPKGWQQTGTMTVGGQKVPVYMELYRGEGESPYRKALNPASGKVQAFARDEVGTIIWIPDPMEASGP